MLIQNRIERAAIVAPLDAMAHRNIACCAELESVSNIFNGVQFCIASRRCTKRFDPIGPAACIGRVCFDYRSCSYGHRGRYWTKENN